MATTIIHESGIITTSITKFVSKGRPSPIVSTRIVLHSLQGGSRQLG